MKTDALIIFTRNPEWGKVKTRLAKSIGNEKALEVYKSLLLHTRNITQTVDCDKFVFYDNRIEPNDIWLDKEYNKRIQSGDDLGEKMQNAFQEVFDLGYKNCIIVGSDLFDLQTQHLTIAFEKLQQNEVVIGPAEDGGYYLLGLQKLFPEIFSNKNWGTETVLKDTLDNLKNYKFDLLETLNDIDTLEDLEKSNYNNFQKKD